MNALGLDLVTSSCIAAASISGKNGFWRYGTSASVVWYQKHTPEQLRAGLQARRAARAAQPTAGTDSRTPGAGHSKPRQSRSSRRGNQFRSMGLGRVELPTSRLSGRLSRVTRFR